MYAYKLLQLKHTGLEGNQGLISSLKCHNQGIKLYLLILAHTLKDKEDVLFSPEKNLGVYGYISLIFLTPGKL